MAYNMPTVTSKLLTFGPGVLYLGVAGATPTVEVGSVEAKMSIGVKRTSLELYQGSPATLVEQVCTKEEVDVSFTGLELNLVNLKYALGAGELSNGDKTMGFGGDMDYSNVALKFVHQTAAGGTVTVSLWAANGSGEASLDFGEEWTKFPLKFSGKQSATDWAGATLAAKQQIFKIVMQDPPM